MPSGRHIALDGCLNLRDIGGYPTTDGREVRRGCLYRSGELCELTDADLKVVARLGIRVVFDLRNEWERSTRPSRIPAGVELIERTSPSIADGPGRTLEDQIIDGDLPVRDDEYLLQAYIDLLDRLTPEIKTILEMAVNANGRPMLFHCVAGKDRTGIVAAVLLGLLGVPHETIIEDYELTTIHYATRRMDAISGLLAERGVAKGRVRHLLEARGPVLDAALRHLHDAWGSYDGYARERLGVSPELPDRLRSALTTRSELAMASRT